MDAATDPRTSQAWLSARARSSTALGSGDGKEWRRLLAELDVDERVLYLDRVDVGGGIRHSLVAVTRRRVLLWNAGVDRIHRLDRARLVVVERDATKHLLTLAAEPGAKPVRVPGFASSQHEFLSVLGKADSTADTQVRIDLSVSSPTSYAFATSPAPPEASGPFADRIARCIRRRKTYFLAVVTETITWPERRSGEAVVAVAGQDLVIVPHPDSNLPEFGRPVRGVQLRADGWLMGTPAGMTEPTRFLHLAGSDEVMNGLRETLERRRNPQQAVDWQAFELRARDLMRRMGFADAQITGAGADAGIDVQAADAVAQVKAHQKPVGRPDVQKLHGAATGQKKRPLYFSLNGYTVAARDWATEVGIALFTAASDGTLTPETPTARQLWPPVAGDDSPIPAPRASPPRTAATPAGPQLGDKVIVTTGEYRGKRGTIVKIGAIGINIRMDGSGKVVRWLSAADLETPRRRANARESQFEAPARSQRNDQKSHSPVGKRVIVTSKPLRGQAGQIIKITRWGATVRLDSGLTARALQPSDYEPAPRRLL